MRRAAVQEWKGNRPLAAAGRTRILRSALCATLLFASAVRISSASDVSLAAEQLSVIHCGRLFDAERGKMNGPTSVMIRAERIVEVRPGKHAIPGTQPLDLSTLTCLPGLIDGHTHLTWLLSSSNYNDKFRWNLADYVVRSTAYARDTLLAGFTSVRNLGDYRNESVALRDAINAGALPGPRIFTAGPAVGSTGGHADPTDGYRYDLAGDPGVSAGVINGPDDAAKAVRLHYKQKDDLIKIMASGGVVDESSSHDNVQLTLDEIRALVATARDYGFTVAAHAHNDEAIERAVLGGVNSIEHATFISDETLRLMKERGVWYVPTLMAGEFVTQQARIPDYYPKQVASKAQAIGPQMTATLTRAYKAGVKIAFGTDAGVQPHGKNAQEFNLLVQAGLSPVAALQAATINAAKLLGQERNLGSISAGKAADLIAVPGNPLKDISVMAQVDVVMKAGAIYKVNGRSP